MAVTLDLEPHDIISLVKRNIHLFPNGVTGSLEAFRIITGRRLERHSHKNVYWLMFNSDSELLQWRLTWL